MNANGLGRLIDFFKISSMPTEFKLPEISEGVETVDIADVLVSEGDTVSPDQNVVEVETDKAAMEVPVKIGNTLCKSFYK